MASLAGLEHVQPVAMEDAILGQHLSPGGATSPGTIIYAFPPRGGHNILLFKPTQLEQAAATNQQDDQSQQAIVTGKYERQRHRLSSMWGLTSNHSSRSLAPGSRCEFPAPGSRGGCMTHTRRGRRPPSDDGGYPLHAVSVQDGDILYQLACPLSTTLHLISFGPDLSWVQIVPVQHSTLASQRHVAQDEDWQNG
ncbi:MAG: hypothetical protein FRX49_08604 [Trebouxia sp. A1-2]|nr:MAG: hypothetical protein FRX49_08604 [Trebouxia sp. A1-2]